ncbi:MAG: cold shock CspA family protein [Psychroserpens sp.]|jgi:cold shock CspA family protein
MENIFYNILWIDDEHETLGGTKGRAKRNGINLIPFKSLNGGMSELERNYPFYDGVLLDAKFFENEDDKEGTEDTYNVHRAKEQLLQLKKKFEVFVLTGQAEAYEDKTFKKAFTKVYKKGSDDEIDRLFTDVKESAACQEDTQLRHSYKRVFDVCTEKYIGEYSGRDLLKLLKPEEESSVDNQFNTLRKIVEDVFIAFNKFQLLPNAFITPSISINESSRFLSGKNHKGELFKEKGYQHIQDTHLPVQISSMLWNILAITQDGSHRAKIDTHVKTLNTTYLFQSVLYQLLDIVVWFKIYVDSNPKTENWSKIDNSVKESNSNIKKGEVINLNVYKGFAFLKPGDGSDNIFIPPHIITNHTLKETDVITGEIEEYTDNRTQELKKRVKKLIE